MFTRLVYICASLGFLSAFAIAQAPPSKVAVIDSYAFADEKSGITKYVAANKTLATEFTPTQNELSTMGSRLEALKKEIENLQRLPAADRKAIEAKAEEGERLQRDLNFKTEDAKSRFAKRQQQVLSPVMEAIGKGLQEYAKLKGYALVFDLAKDQNGLLVVIGDQSVDVTKDFIIFFNAKP